MLWCLFLFISPQDLFLISISLHSTHNHWKKNLFSNAAITAATPNIHTNDPFSAMHVAHYIQTWGMTLPLSALVPTPVPPKGTLPLYL